MPYHNASPIRRYVLMGLLPFGLIIPSRRPRAAGGLTPQQHKSTKKRDLSTEAAGAFSLAGLLKLCTAKSSSSSSKIKREEKIQQDHLDQTLGRALTMKDGGSAIIRLIELETIDPNHKSSDGMPLIHQVIAAGKLEALEVLLANHVKIIEQEVLPTKDFKITVLRDTEGNTVLHQVIKYGTPEMLEVLLQHMIDYKSQELREKLLKAKNKAGTFPLSIAVSLGHVWAYKQLLAAGSKPNRKDSDGIPLLHHIIASDMPEERKMDMVKLFLSYGAKIRGRCKEGNNALHRVLNLIPFSSANIAHFIVLRMINVC